MLACSATSSVTASGICVTSAITVTTTSIVLVTCGRMMTPRSSSQATPKYAAKIQATASNVPAVGFPPRMTRAIDGTQISTRNSTTGQLRSEWCLIQSPSGSRSLTCALRPRGVGGLDA